MGHHQLVDNGLTSGRGQVEIQISLAVSARLEIVPLSNVGMFTHKAAVPVDPGHPTDRHNLKAVMISEGVGGDGVKGPGVVFHTT